MATSNNILWELNRDEIIKAAYRKLGIPGEGNTLSTSQLTDGAEALNGVIALAVTDGMALWKRTTLEVVPNNVLQVYTVTGAVKIPMVYLKDTGSGTQYELQPKSLYDFMNLPVIPGPGSPNSYTAQNTIGGMTVSIWPPYSDGHSIANKKILIVYQRKFDGMFASGQTLDMPSYWNLPIVYQTAVTLAPEYGIPVNERMKLEQEAKGMWKRASDYGDDEGSVYFYPAEH